jgi:hypothetical protein
MSGGVRAAVLVAVAALAGCDNHFIVSAFAGTNLVLELRSAPVTAAGQHLEMWGRNRNDDIVRIGYRLEPGQPQLYGFMIRAAVDPGDPCMINDAGYLLTDPRAYPSDVTEAGVVQTPAEQALQITLRIRQVVAVSVGGLQTSSLLLTMPYDTTPAVVVAADATPAARRQACLGYWAASPYAYTPSPLTLTAPIHGTTMGPVDYVTSVPQATFNSIDLTTLYDLGNLEEFWMTLESKPPEAVDPLHRGTPYLQGRRAERGRGTVNFDLTGDGGVSGGLLVILSGGA